MRRGSAMAMGRGIASALTLLLLLAHSAVAQTHEHVLGGRALAPGAAARKVTSTAGSDEARAVVRRILSVIGIPLTNFEVRASYDVVNDDATAENGGKDRLILYNPQWMEGLKSSTSKWSDWVVLTHEVGHHVAFHMDPTFPNHEAELQADYFAGFILNKLGAPLADAQLAMAMVATDDASLTHPAKAKRVAEVRKGWEAGAQNVGANVIPASIKVPERSALTAAAPAEQRMTLLIGNSNYKAWGVTIKNPKNDVIAIGRQLRALGFSTTVIYDATRDQIASAIKEFRDEAETADWAIVYYAGTGIEVDGTNYMIPIDADDRHALTFAREYPQMALNTAFEAVRGAKRLRLVIADACRVDPANLPGTTGYKPQSFKITEPPHGVLVAYSTAAGQYAQDGTGNLSPYAQALLQA